MSWRRRAATGLLVVLVLLGGAFGVARWLFRDGIFVTSGPADYERAAVFAADPVMGYVPPGWVPDAGGVRESVGQPEVANPVKASLGFEIAGQDSDAVAADLLVIVEAVEDLGWSRPRANCGRLEAEFGRQGGFTVEKKIDGVEAKLGVSIKSPTGDGQHRGVFQILGPLVRSGNTTGRAPGDISCLEAAAGGR